MKYFKSIELNNIDNLYLCLCPEIKNLSNKRVNCSMDLIEDKIIVKLSAKDEIALTTILNSINNLVTIHKKTKKLIKTIH